MARQYQVRIPEEFRDAFPELKPGQDRLRQRWATKVAGRAWAKDIEERIAQLRAGSDMAKVRKHKPADQITIEAAALLWLASMQVRDRSKRSYELNLVPICGLAGGEYFSAFGLREWDEYCKRRRKGLPESDPESGRRKRGPASDDALKRERQTLQALAKWAIPRGYSVNAQVLAIPQIEAPRRIVRRFEPESTRKAIRGLSPGSRSRVIAELVAGTGMRAGEVQHARVEWIRWTERLIAIPHSEEYSPKGGRPRSLPLSKALARTLKTWVGDRKAGLLFPSTLRRGTGAALWRVIDELQGAGVIPAGKGHGLHDLRAHYLSTLAMRGLRIRDVQELAGHVHSKTTDLYMQPSPTYLEAARKALEVDSDLDSGGEEPGE